MQKCCGIVAFALATLTLACGDGPRDLQAERRAEALETLSRSPEDIRTRVSQTCGRWADLQGECDEELLRGDILDCWLEAGLPHLKRSIERGQRQRARKRRVVMHHSLCVERRGWRFLPETGGYF